MPNRPESEPNGAAGKKDRGEEHTMNMAFDLKATRLADIALQEASLNIWDTKYRLKTKSGEPVDRDIDGTYERVAKALAAVEEPAKRGEWDQRFLWALQRGAIPGGRLTANAGGEYAKPATSRSS